MKIRKQIGLGLKLCLLLTMVFAGTAFAAAPSGYWYLDDTAEPYVDTLHLLDGSNNAACDQGCPTAGATGAVGTAQTFNGTDDGIVIAPSLTSDKIFDWQDDANFSIEIWFKMAGTLAGTDETEVLIGRSDNSAGSGHLQWWMGVRNVGGAGVRVAARLRDQEGDGNGVLITNTNTPGFTVVANALWHQAILVKDGTTVSLYVDGALEDSKTVDYTATQTDTGFKSDDAPLGIGFLYTVNANPTPPSRDFFFNGGIDQVAIYNAALTAAEVLTSFQAGSNHQYLQFAPVFENSDLGVSALGYEFSANVSAVANPAVDTYALVTAPGGMSIGATSGDVSWMPTDLQIGPNVFNVSATNTQGTTAQDLTVDILDVCVDLDAYWDLNESAEPFDGVAHGEPAHPDAYDAMCASGGCPTADAAPQANNALAFDGSSQGLEVAASATSDLVFDWSAAESFTIEFFMKRSATGFADGATEVMIGRILTGTASPQWWIGLRDDAGGSVQPRLFARLEAVNGDGDGKPITNTISPANVTDGTWHHVALVYNHVDHKVSLFADGALEATETIAYNAATGFQDSTHPMTIGHLNNGYYFGGSLDEIAFFGAALDTAVLNQHANQNLQHGYCNDPPPSISSNPSSTDATEGVEWAYDPTADQDDEGDTYVWSLATAPSTMSIDPATGAIRWTADSASVGTQVPVTVLVTDGFGGTATQSFQLTVSSSGSTGTGGGTGTGGDTPASTSGGGGGGGGCFIGSVSGKVGATNLTSMYCFIVVLAGLGLAGLYRKHTN